MSASLMCQLNLTHPSLARITLPQCAQGVPKAPPLPRRGEGMGVGGYRGEISNLQAGSPHAQQAVSRTVTPGQTSRP